MSNASCGIATVVIGREFSLIPLLSYFKNVEIPENIDISLYIVLGCDLYFETKLKNKTKMVKFFMIWSQTQ